MACYIKKKPNKKREMAKKGSKHLKGFTFTRDYRFELF